MIPQRWKLFRRWRDELEGAERGSGRGTGYAVEVAGGVGGGERGIAGFGGGRFGDESIVEDIFLAHSQVERIESPETFEEVVVIAPFAFEEAAAHGDSRACEVGAREVGAEAVEDAVGHLRGHQRL